MTHLLLFIVFDNIRLKSKEMHFERNSSYSFFNLLYV